MSIILSADKTCRVYSSNSNIGEHTMVPLVKLQHWPVIKIKTLINVYVHEMQSSQHMNLQNMEIVNHDNTVTNDTSHTAQLHLWKWVQCPLTLRKVLSPCTLMNPLRPFVTILLPSHSLKYYTLCGFRYSVRWVFKLYSSRLSRCVVLKVDVDTNLLEEHAASINGPDDRRSTFFRSEDITCKHIRHHKPADHSLIAIIWSSIRTKSRNRWELPLVSFVT
jgi:hypothetical protein